MFTWICPQCGREVPPAYDDCPDCSAKTAQPAGVAGPAAAVAAQPAVKPSAVAASPPPVAAPPPRPPQPSPPPSPAYETPLFGSLGLSAKTPPPPAPSPYATPPVYATAQPPMAPQPAPQAYAAAPQFQPSGPPPAGYAPPAYYAPPQQPAYGAPMVIGAGRAHLPAWLLTVIFAVGFVVVVGGIYWLFGSSHSSSQATGATPGPANAPPAAVTNTSSLQRYFEVSGVRFLQDSKQNTQAKFVIINHSDAEVSGLTGTVTILGKSSKSEEPEGTITFSTNIGPNESKELTEPFNTKLRVYELPDWQNVGADLRITGPQ
jgi:hypothetical protein